MTPYSIQWLMRLKPEQFRKDLSTLSDLLKQEKIKPLVAHRFPLAEARQAQQLLGRGGVTGKIVLLCESTREPSATEDEEQATQATLDEPSTAACS